MREKISDELRKRVLERDGYKCRYCGSNSGPFHLDHVYPVAKGGETSFDNLVTSCERCNLKKHAKVGIWPNPVDSGNRALIIPLVLFLIMATVLSLSSTRIVGQPATLSGLIAFVLSVVGLIYSAKKI